MCYRINTMIATILYLKPISSSKYAIRELISLNVIALYRISLLTYWNIIFCIIPLTTLTDIYFISAKKLYTIVLMHSLALYTWLAFYYCIHIQYSHPTNQDLEGPQYPHQIVHGIPLSRCPSS
jgi:hypothetical protein